MSSKYSTPSRVPFDSTAASREAASVSSATGMYESPGAEDVHSALRNYFPAAEHLPNLPVPPATRSVRRQNIEATAAGAEINMRRLGYECSLSCAPGDGGKKSSECYGRWWGGRVSAWGAGRQTSASLKVGGHAARATTYSTTGRGQGRRIQSCTSASTGGARSLSTWRAVRGMVDVPCTRVVHDPGGSGPNHRVRYVLRTKQRLTTRWYIAPGTCLHQVGFALIGQLVPLFGVIEEVRGSSNDAEDETVGHGDWMRKVDGCETRSAVTLCHTPRKRFGTS
ncbi:hypothetical protein B0H10DRAFT_1950503 [Mycena sp. CBHHK59/15]|nr:hypothetical protein B0H10DRAFT_1950503 [Mycena sp. CBHHK59/15]